MAAQYSTKQVVTVVVALLLVAGISFAIANQSSSDNNLTPVVAFAFDTYCPVDSPHALSLINAQLAAQGLPPLDFDYRLNPNIYVVYAQARPSNASDPSSPAMLYYCGLAKRWWEANCGSARFVCSFPGPMFYFNVR